MPDVDPQPGTAYVLPETGESFPNCGKIIVDCEEPYSLAFDIPVAERYDYMRICASAESGFDFRSVASKYQSFDFDNLMIEPALFVGEESNLIDTHSVVFMKDDRPIARWKVRPMGAEIEMI